MPVKWSRATTCAKKSGPADTFVDFDHSLNTAVNKIREALGDFASSPRFLETLARRGYRFIAPVDSVAAAESAALDMGTRAGAPAPRNLNYPTTPAAGSSCIPNCTCRFPGVAWCAPFCPDSGDVSVFYLNGLAHLHGVDRVASSFLPGWRALVIVGAVLVTERQGFRCASTCCRRSLSIFARLAETFGRLFPFVLADGSALGYRAFPAAAADRRGHGVRRDLRLYCMCLLERTLVRLAYPLQS